MRDAQLLRSNPGKFLPLYTSAYVLYKRLNCDASQVLAS